jgi:two-component system response regulator
MTTSPVLLVEDDQDDIDVTLRAFRRAGLADIAIARDGVEALDYLHGGVCPLPRVVFLDLRMPRLDGFEVLKRVRGDPRTACLPVVVLTSSTEPDDLAAAYQAGANSYVRKTIDVDRFEDVAQQLGRYWLCVNEVAP